MSETSPDEITPIVGQIVTTYLTNNKMDRDDVPAFVREVRRALTGEDEDTVAKDAADPESAAPRHEDAATEGSGRPNPEPAVPVSKSYTDQHVFCLACGRSFRALARHLRAAHGLSEADYRALYGLSDDHPLVAPAYSRERAAQARAIGLNQKGRQARAKSGRTSGKRATNRSTNAGSKTSTAA